MPKATAKFRAKEEIIEEISTLPDGLAVRVRRDGKIRVVDSES